MAMMNEVAADRIEQARAALLAAIAGGTAGYVGGDFVVHVPGIDAAIDAAMRLCGECDDEAAVAQV